jgi:hypothetical protein
MSGGAAPDVAALLLDLERRLAVRDFAGSAGPDALLAPDFREFGSSGRVFSRGEVLRVLANDAAGAPADVAIDDGEVRLVASGVAVVTYRAERRNADGSPPLRTLRSSVWELSPDGWLMVFHQGTPAA